MAVSLELNSAAIAADLNLNAAVTAGLRISSWHQAVASPVYGGQPGPVKETMDLMVESTTHNLLAGHIQALDSYRVQADAYMRDRTATDPVWLEAKMDGETGTRRAMVMSINEGYRLPLYALHDGPPQFTTMIRLEIWRMPWWEDPAHIHGTAATPSAAAQVAYDHTAGAGGDVLGDVPARLDSLLVIPQHENTDIIGRLWMGFRSENKHSSLASFAPVWECEDGTNGTDAADGADATASGGNRVRVTPGTATWAKRMSITMLQATGALGAVDDNYGLFVWLLRAQVSAGTYEVQLRFGDVGMADDDHVRGPIVEVTNTSWDFTNQGTYTLPIVDRQIITTAAAVVSLDQTSNVQIWARRTDGAGTLDLDCLCPVPADEGFLFSDGYTLTYTDADTYDVWLFAESPQGTTQAATYNHQLANGWWTSVLAPSVQNFRPPVGDGRLYIVYARAGSSVITDTINVEAIRFERWASLRGAE